MSLPFFLIWGTRVNIQQKVGLVIVFSFGLFIIAAAIVRAVEITGKAYSDQAALAIWSVAESSICNHDRWLPPPFRAVISKGPNSTQYRYGVSSANSVSYPASSRVNLRSNTTNWSEAPLPVQDHRQYRNLDFEMNAPQNVQLDGGRSLDARNPRTRSCELGTSKLTWCRNL
ncbi:hypothetical protein N7491_009455 [Penicillium cf. griseofulvum]|nr:hypothetical protein N7491_009455 [Penicillium cf. griseofulvum]